MRTDGRNRDTRRIQLGVLMNRIKNACHSNRMSIISDYSDRLPERLHQHTRGGLEDAVKEGGHQLEECSLTHKAGRLTIGSGLDCV